MSTVVLPAPVTPPMASVGPEPMRWTAEDFYQMGGLPSIRDRKVMLIDGEVLSMPAPSPLHDMALQLVSDGLRTVFPPTHFCVRVQMGMFFGINTDPVPDIAIVPGTPRQHARQPQTALLVVEVADSSINFDTGDKASLYAAAGIADYWVFDVNDQRIRVCRDPQPDAAAKYGSSYKSIQVLGPRDTLAPLAALSAPHAAPTEPPLGGLRGASVPVIDLLP